MSISKLITSASLAFAMIGGAIAFAPASVDAAGASKVKRFCPQQVGHSCRDNMKPKPRKPVCKPGSKCLH